MMTDNEKVKNLQKAIGIIRKSVVEFRDNAQAGKGPDTVDEAMNELLEIVGRVINIYG